MVFNKAVQVVLNDEGRDKITDDPQDPGGRTKWGISQRLLTAIQPTKKVDELTEADAIAIYHEHFWKEYKLDTLEEINDVLTSKIFNFCVTAGPDPAFRCLQRAMRACLVDVKEDGVMGPITRSKVVDVMNTACGAPSLMCAYRSEIAGYYRDLDKPRFEAGWVNRAYRA